MINFDNYRSILCLNGSLPLRDFFSTALPIIAADGAANTLMEMGIQPQAVIGDLDSLEAAYVNKLTTHHHQDQSLNDFQKSLLYLNENNLLPTLVLGVNGGFLDHVLNNINVLMENNCDFYAESIFGFVVQQGVTKTFTLPQHTKLSIFGIPTATLTTQGLKWELDNTQLNFPGTSSCFNRSKGENITFTVTTGAALVMVYLDGSR